MGHLPDSVRDQHSPGILNPPNSRLLSYGGSLSKVYGIYYTKISGELGPCCRPLQVRVQPPGRRRLSEDRHRQQARGRRNPGVIVTRTALQGRRQTLPLAKTFSSVQPVQRLCPQCH